ncbi:2-dehydro-3-deoxygluconokinase [Kitasatospora sp. MAA4]|uniref:sugar kinase n=1 Tax=Kitasatospora sp. MAA4 TaxID=3035093 RepID=UPI00247516B8|nr:sugar kinase [Kitasatospora sp. MAA4]MDH6133695.1 2-dehydro-3-deoxygluconokinase [Kitasatospora sp. MAA4]
MTGTPPLDVVTVGETMAALRATGPVRLGAPMQLSVAGAEANVAIGLARLGHRAGWVGRVGDDEFGALVLRTLRAEQVDVSHARLDPDGRPTGLLAREDRIADLVSVAYYRTGSAGSALRASDVLPALNPGVRVLHLTGITPALSADAAEAVRAAAARARELGITVCLDVNYRARLWSPAAARTALLPLARLADVLVASADELHLVSEDPSLPEPDALTALLAQGRREVVLTRGGDGASATTIHGTVDTPARKVPVVDVVGAGDAFVAGYLSGLLDGLDVEGRLQRAAATGAFAVATRGDWEGLPTRRDLSLLDQPAGTTLR